MHVQGLLRIEPLNKLIHQQRNINRWGWCEVANKYLKIMLTDIIYLNKVNGYWHTATANCLVHTMGLSNICLCLYLDG